MENVNDIHKVVRSNLFSIMPAEGRLCFSYMTPEDAGPGMNGDLFEQNEDFLMVEVIVENVRRAGPGVHSPRRVFGVMEMAYYSKERLDPYRSMVNLEQAADHFRETTIEGVRFRDFIPSGEIRDRGFTATTGVIAFEFETRAKHS